MELIERDSEDNRVEEHLVERPDALLEKYLVLELTQVPFVSGLEDLVVEPMLEKVVATPEPHEEIAGVGHLLLLLTLLQPA